MRSLLALFLLLTAAMAAVSSVREAPLLAEDPVLEARVMELADELRCLVCQNETIAASHADLAVDLRAQIRNQLRDGRTERQVLDFMVERYGEFVLYRPRFSATTLLLWVGPFVLLLVAAGALVLNIRRHARTAAAHALTPEQVSRARQLLGADLESRS